MQEKFPAFFMRFFHAFTDWGVSDKIWSCVTIAISYCGIWADHLCRKYGPEAFLRNVHIRVETLLL